MLVFSTYSVGLEMAELRETIGREALLALSAQYQSVADALMEIIDNPFDYRHGQQLFIELTVSKQSDLIEVLDFGGQGMNAATLADWISWGTGHQHSSEDIGQWHVGGKLAAIYLADSIEITCRMRGEAEIWRFRDKTWGSRTSLYSGIPEQLRPEDLTGRLAEVAARPGTGFSSIRMRKLKNHRYEIGILEAKLSNTYRALLERGQCEIKVNGKSIEPLDIPADPTHEDRTTHISATKLPGGVTVRGQIWITDRNKFKVGRGVGLKAGIRTVFNGRLITDGEEFRHYLAGRGSLQRLVGEIEINHLKPNTTKDNWDRSSPGWYEVDQFMHDQMQALVAFLNSLIEGKAVSRELRKRAQSVRRDLEEVFKRLESERLNQARGAMLPGGVAPEGRQAPSNPTPEPGGGEPRQRGQTVNRTPAPEDAVGRLLRRVATGIPEIDFDDLGRTGRSQLRMTDAGPRIVINNSFPLYDSIGETTEYLVETVLLHLVAQDEAQLTPPEFAERLDHLMFLWDDVVAGRS